jgi:hypothetical protein
LTANKNGMLLQNSSNNLLNQIKVFDNYENWIIFTGQHSNNLLYKSQIFKHLHNGVVWWNGLLVINNTHIYNNNTWLYMVSGSVNNSIIYNNYNNVAIGVIFNNSVIYNNSAGQLLDWVFINSNMYNNWQQWFQTWYVCGNSNIFWNDNLNFAYSWDICESFDINTSYIDTSGIISYNRFVNPMNRIGQKLLNGTDWVGMRWVMELSIEKPIKYIYGKNILKQKQIWGFDSSWNPILFGTIWIDWNPSDYIALVKMPLSSIDQSIVEYYYGPDSEFTRNRKENDCTPWAFTVDYINDQTTFNSKLVNNQPLWHTIYVLKSNFDFWVTSTITINDDCIAIVSQKTGSILNNSNTNNGSIIKVNWVENVILDNFSLNGNNISNDGIYLYKVSNQELANNNTIANIRSYSHKENGITLWVWASYNNIMNTQTWNNMKNGIELNSAGTYNIINNSISYNNAEYGITFGNGGHHNTVNNSQFFNNGIGGIFADYTTKQNILNNIHTYSNWTYGLNFKRSSGNKLNNIYSYNNQVGLNITDISCVNNTFNGELALFANSQENLSGTDGNDAYLSSEGTTLIWWNNGVLETGEINMNCSWATNPKYFNSIWFFDQDLGCIATWVQSWLTSSPNPNYITYLFGLEISKQIAPVWYLNNEIVRLNNQFNSESYIWEVNPIIWTYPGNVVILSGNEQDLWLNVSHEMNVVYGESNMINHDFDIKFTLYPSEITGHVEKKVEWQWYNIGTGESGVDFQTIEWIRIVVQTPDEYYKTITGVLYIGTEQYWNNVGFLNLRTIPDPTPPTITWSGNINLSSLRSGQANTWQAVITWIYNATIASYYFVTWADDCNTGVAWNLYNGELKNIVLEPNYNILNDKYVCIVAKDTVNWKYTTGLSNQIKISKIEFVDDIVEWPVNYDIIDIDFQNVENYWYRWINSSSQCNNSLSGLDLIPYDGPIVINDISLNGKYMCIYWEDGAGNSKYILSNHKLNIVDYSQFVYFTDAISESWVLSDTISVYFTWWANFFLYKKYKRVDEAVDCNNSWWMEDYTGAITIENEDLNWKYFCLYTKEASGWIENYLISANSLKIDTTKPEVPEITSPTSGQSIHWLIVETTGANDTQSGLSGFDYEIALDATFLDRVLIWTTNSTENKFSPMFNRNDREYVIRLRAIDKVGNKSDRSNKVNFDYNNLSGFEFINVINAQLLTAYVSNEITMWWLGLDEVVEGRVTNGRLFRNWNLLGTTGLVKNNDKLTIKMLSSSGYNETVETRLIVANRIVPRKITTAQSGYNTTWAIIDSGACALISTGDRLNAQSILNSIVGMYTDQTQLKSFLLVMKSMLQDNVALVGETWANKMKCFLFLVDQYLVTNFGVSQDPNIHKAPNCKEYTIVHNTGDNTYYSPNTIKKTKFGSRDELIKFLDSNNPGDCHVNTYWNTISYNNSDPNRHIAPNGKVYRIESSSIWYSSPDFINAKYFATILELRAFVDRNNPAIVVRDHTVDATFEPIVHKAPNDKEYKIYKTNRGYMSYKLMKVQYFDTLEVLKNYIDKNNK